MYYTGELTEQGFVVAYKWDGAEWNQMGDTLFGNEHNWSRIGRKIDLSGDGRRMRLTYDAWSILDIPRCAVFEFDGTDWVQLGGTMINGSGFSDVAISGDGNTVVFGFADEIDKLGSEFAYFWAMEYIAGWWELKGDGDVYGPDGLKFARSLDVNWDGTYILVGAPALLPGDAADEKVYRFSVHEDFGWWL